MREAWKTTGVVGHDAPARAEDMAQERQRADSALTGYLFEAQEISLPWGGTFPAVVASLRGDESEGESRVD